MKRKSLRKSYAKCIVSMALILGLTIPSIHRTDLVQAAQAAETFNYAKAFQLSMYFYDANKCGEGIEGGALSWRGDCHLEDKKVPLIPKDTNGNGTNLSSAFITANKAVLDPDGDGCVDLSGGYHDAGDHVQFGLPQSYAGSTLGWGYYEFTDSYQDIGAQEHMEDILRGFNDYFLKCTFRKSNGDVVAFAYQVGDGTTDHNYWGAPELQTTTRPAWFATSETAASDQCAGAAASLAINYLNFKDTDPDYALECLDTAKALYTFAKQNRGLGFSGGFYNSSYDEDEMSWAAVWLNIATGDNSYINDITSVSSNGTYTGYMQRIISTTASTWQNIWVHSWDTVWGGVFAKLAPITNNPEHWYFFRWNLEYWSGVAHEDPNDTNFMATTPDGFRVINTWGSARYNAAAQLCALVYNKYKPNQGFVNWCKDQMDYILGDNPMNRCYLVGYGENSAKNPHHRAAHGSLTNSMLVPAVQKHVLWGALVGGPDTTDNHVDDITDYVYNEVAIDYNAGFVGALAGLYEIYGQGQQPDPSLPVYQVDETPFYVQGKIEQENQERTQLTIEVTNDTSCYPRRVSTLKARYFLNISEMIAKGQSINDLSLQVMYDQSKVIDGAAVKISTPVAWDAEEGLYYIDLDWSGITFHGSREIQIAFVPAQDSSYNVNWDPTNDPSRVGLSTTKSMTTNIPLYVDGALVYGNEPGKNTSTSIKLTQPSNGTVYDYTSTITPITLETQVEASETNVTRVEFYADNVKIGEDTTAPYTFDYVPEQTGSASSKNILLTAKAFMEAGVSATSNGVTITVKFEEGSTGTSDLRMEVQGLGSASTNTISRKFILTNTGNQNIDLSGVTIRYYFTKDVNANLTFFCDHAGLSLNSAPWHATVSSGVQGQYITMNTPVQGADTYLELSFNGVTYPIHPGKQLECEIRITNASWTNFNQDNDYSYGEPNHVVLLVNGSVVSGVTP